MMKNGFLALALLAACNANPFNTDTGDTTGRSTVHSIDINGLQRNYLLHTPSKWTSDEQLPLIFMLHGNGGEPLGLESISGMSILADNQHFFVCYPWGIRAAWEWRHGTNRDVELIDQLITSLSSSHNIDQDRVYAVGFSLGGYLAHNLASELGDRLAGTASLSGSMSSSVAENFDATDKVNVLIIHGTSDDQVSYAGEEQINFYNQSYNCSNDLTEIDISADLGCSSYTVIQKTFSSCSDSSRVRLLRVEEGEHEWFCFSSSKVWEFFSE